MTLVSSFFAITKNSMGLQGQYDYIFFNDITVN